MKTTLDVSIILINYKTSHYVKNIIADIIKNTRDISFEIIVVDNSNDEEEFNKLLQLKTNARIINTGANIGFGKGNNLGTKYANGDYLLFLNTDTQLIGNTIGILHGFISNNHRIGIVGPNMFTKDGLPNNSYEKEEKSLKREGKGFIYNHFHRKHTKDFFFNSSGKPLNIQGYICGACLMISKENFTKLGGFDDDIFMYAEDALLCYRLRNGLGLEVYNVPDAKIIHFEGGSFDKISKTRAAFIANGNYIYYKKCFGEKIAKKYLKKYISRLKEKAFILLFCRKKEQRQDTLILLNAYKAELSKNFN